MSLVEQYHNERKARLRRIDEKAAQLRRAKIVAEMVSAAPLPPKPCVHFSRYLMDEAYQRAWSMEVVGWDPLEKPASPSIEQIQRVVCEHFDISRNDINSERRSARLVRPRQIAAHLCRRLTSRSYPEIGRRMGGRDHTTILYADKKIERLAREDQSLRDTIDLLIIRLGGEK